MVGSEFYISKVYKNRFKVLNDRELYKHIVKYRTTGDPESGNKIILSTYKLIASLLAKMAKSNGQEYEDRLSDCFLALLPAIKKYKFYYNGRHYKFSSYLKFWIEAKLNGGNTADKAAQGFLVARNGGRMRVLNYAQANIRRFRRDEKKQGLVDSNLDYVKNRSLEEVINEERGIVLQDAISSPQEYFTQDLPNAQLKKLLDSIITRYLTEKERIVVILHYGINGCKKTTLERIGIKLGCSKERVRQIEKGALKRLKRKAERHGLKYFLEERNE